MQGNCGKKSFRTKLSETIKDTCKSKQSFQLQVIFNNCDARQDEQKEASPAHPPETENRCGLQSISSSSSSATSEQGGKALDKPSTFQKKKKINTKRLKKIHISTSINRQLFTKAFLQTRFNMKLLSLSTE